MIEMGNEVMLPYVSAPACELQLTHPDYVQEASRDPKLGRAPGQKYTE
jgi:hypothetical protein